MSVTTEPAQDLLEQASESQHPHCIVCGQAGDCGLGLRFRSLPDCSVEAQFACPARYQGYNGMLHGGVISAIADGAMTNCLFARGIRAVTAELTVRFRHPIVLESPLEVTARVTRESSPLFLVEATLVQEGERRATATGKFMERPLS
ncbi:MAG: PaaI family thioesterase [Planctomycetota bacterium]